VFKKLLLTGALCAGFCFSATSAFAQTDFDAFWARFKTAVIRNDKATVASLTRFPLYMPFGIKNIRTKAKFLADYNGIMNMEANVRRCFAATKPERVEKRYGVWCTFKSYPESSEDRPIEYYFIKTKTGWKFAGIDNINE